MRRSTHPLRSLPVEELFHIEPRIAFEQVINGPYEFVRNAGERFALPMFVLQAGERFLRRRIMPPKQDSGFRKGPRERRIADLGAGGAVALARGCLGPFARRQ